MAFLVLSKWQNKPPQITEILIYILSEFNMCFIEPRDDPRAHVEALLFLLKTQSQD